MKIALTSHQVINDQPPLIPRNTYSPCCYNELNHLCNLDPTLLTFPCFHLSVAPLVNATRLSQSSLSEAALFSGREHKGKITAYSLLFVFESLNVARWKDKNTCSTKGPGNGWGNNSFLPICSRSLLSAWRAKEGGGGELIGVWDSTESVGKILDRGGERGRGGVSNEVWTSIHSVGKGGGGRERRKIELESRLKGAVMRRKSIKRKRRRHRELRESIRKRRSRGRS